MLFYYKHYEYDTAHFSDVNPMKYRSYYYDAEIDMYYLQSRYYWLPLCRFLNADLPEYAKIQKDETAGINLFAYCNNDPVNNADPTGYISNKIKAKINNLLKTIKSTFLKIVNTIKGEIKNYVKKLFYKDKNGNFKIKIVVFSASIDLAISILVSRIIYKAATSALNIFLGQFAARYPNYLFLTLKGIAEILVNSKILCFIGSFLIRKGLKLPGGIKSFEDDFLQTVISERIRIIERPIRYIATFTSIGSILSFPIDIIDGKWDGYLTIKVRRGTVVL